MHVHKIASQPPDRAIIYHSSCGPVDNSAPYTRDKSSVIKERRRSLKHRHRVLLSSESRNVYQNNTGRLMAMNCRQPFLSKNFMGWMAAVVFLFVCLLHPTWAIETEACTYDIDFKTNSAKITCKGRPGTVSIYANTATVQADGVFTAGADSTTALQKPESEKTGANKNGDSQKNDRTGRKGTDSPSGNSDKGGKSEPPQNIRKPKGKGDSGETDDDDFDKRDPEYEQKHAAIHSSHFSDVVMNATEKLKRAKRQLSTYGDSIRNLSAYLDEGDNNLRMDMERLRRSSNSAKELKEGISAAMRNQFSYLRYSMTIRSHELERLVQSLTMLVDVTTEGLEGALRAHKTVLEEVAHVNRTIRAVRRKMIHEKRRERKHKGKKDKAKRPKDNCPKTISAVGAGTYRVMEDVAAGSYMVESYKNGPYQPVWIMQGSAPTDNLQQYDDDSEVDYNLVAKYFPLPYQCVGTGHAVFRRHFYCNLANSGRVIKYHLSQMDPVSELTLPGTDVDRFPYRIGLNTSVDLAVDEKGLWAIYATKESGGKIVITKIGHRIMDLTQTWTTSFPKSHAGNAFMICGVLYVTDSATDIPTYIRYMYDTETSTEQRLDRGELPFPNSALIGLDWDEQNTEAQNQNKQAHVSMLSYDFKQSKIFAWNDGRIESYPVYFKDNP